MNILSRIVAGVVVFGVLAVISVNLTPSQPEPIIEPRAEVVTYEAQGPSALCADPTKLVSERGPDGPTVYYCAD